MKNTARCAVRLPLWIVIRVSAPNEMLQETSHAIDGSWGFYGLSRANWRLSERTCYSGADSESSLSPRLVSPPPSRSAGTKSSTPWLKPRPGEHDLLRQRQLRLPLPGVGDQPHRPVGRVPGAPALRAGGRAGAGHRPRSVHGPARLTLRAGALPGRRGGVTAGRLLGPTPLLRRGRRRSRRRAGTPDPLSSKLHSSLSLARDNSPRLGFAPEMAPCSRWRRR